MKEAIKIDNQQYEKQQLGRNRQQQRNSSKGQGRYRHQRNHNNQRKEELYRYKPIDLNITKVRTPRVSDNQSERKKKGNYFNCSKPSYFI